MSFKRAVVVAKVLACVLLGAQVVMGCSGKKHTDGTGGAAGSFGTGGSPVTGGTGGGGMGGTGGGGTGGTMQMQTGVVCGAVTCMVGQQCVSGACTNVCMTNAQCPGGACCNGVCATTQTDHSNCGACGKACTPTEMCSAGKCTPAMCSGTPGAPVHVDVPLSSGDDAGVADNDAGPASGSGDVIGSNGCPPNEECTSSAMGTVCQCGTGAGCPSDEHCAATGACMCGASAGCKAGASCCGDSCFDLRSDNANCGACGNVCKGGSTCVAGVCGCPNTGDSVCGDQCVNRQTDELNCGNCGHRCAQGATCTAGQCQCDDANAVVCRGKCVLLDTSSNCGACGTVCDAPTTCRKPSGRPLGCYCANVNEVPCNGACVALGTTSNCGSCGDACSAPADTCRNGSCQCPTAGQTACGNHCVDVNTGRANTTPIEDCGVCGVTCLSGSTCTAGECSCPGATTQKFCDEDPVTGTKDGTFACIAATTTKNCGNCGNACLDDSACQKTGSGSAAADYHCVCINSDAGKTHCPGPNGGCKVLTTDEQNCGACGRACPSGATCTTNGNTTSCRCPGGSNMLACSVSGQLACVDTDTDANNCGSCGHTCTSSQECCGGSCVNPSTAYRSDNQNCGTCGHACASSGCGFLGLGSCSCSAGVCGN